MRNTVGYSLRRRRPKRPCDSFAYAGGEIAVRKLPVPDMASAPLLPPHLIAVPQPIEPPAVIPTSTVALEARQIEEIDPAMDKLNASTPDNPEPAAFLTETLPASELDAQTVIPESEPTPTAPMVAAPKPQHHRRIGSGASAKLKRRDDGDTSLSHHEARCTICNHRERAAIDEAFLHWQRPTAIAHEFQLGDRRIVYRHAHALGLFHQRAAKSRRSLEFIIEQAETVTATADSVIRAVRAHSCLGEDGRWTEPRKEVLITQKMRFERTNDLIDTYADQNVDLNPAPPTKLPKLIDTLFRHSTRLFASVF